MQWSAIGLFLFFLIREKTKKINKLSTPNGVLGLMVLLVTRSFRQQGLVWVFRVSGRSGMGARDLSITLPIFGSGQIYSFRFGLDSKTRNQKYPEKFGSHLVPVSVWLFRVVRLIQVKYQVFWVSNIQDDSNKNLGFYGLLWILQIKLS